MPRWVCNDVRKWAENRRNVGVVGQTTKQMPAFKPTHEQRCACMIFEGVSTKSKTNSCLCKKLIIGDKTKPLGSQSVKPKNEKLGLPIVIHKV